MMTSELALMDARYRAHLHAQRLDQLHNDGLDVVVGRREGARFEDLRTGDWLWNCHSNGGTFNLGHRHPAVISAVIDSLDRVDVGNHHLPSPLRAAAAERLAATTNMSLPGVVFSGTGTEANELAMKVAQIHTGRRGVIVAEGCYHGTGVVSMAATVQLAKHLGFDDQRYVVVPWNDSDALADALDESIGLVMLEAIPATSGFPMPDADYLSNVAAACRRNGTLLLIDEVQTGLGRTGAMWSHQCDGITPDLMVTGKGLSGGIYPIAATLLSPELFATWSNSARCHVSTFGGAEPGCAAALATIDVLQSEGFADHVKSLADRFAAGFAGAPFTVRQRGLVMAFSSDHHGGHWAMWRALRAHGVFTMPASFDRTAVQFKPPLIVTDAQADEIIAQVCGALG
jgi:putrescine aminotransferase